MSSLIKLLRQAHRNVGVVLSIFLLLLVVTGVLLNHTEDLALHEASAPAWVADRYYETPDIEAFEVDAHYYYVIGETLYRDRVAIGQCEALAGAALVDQQVALLCDDELLLYSTAGQLIEKIGAAHGLPEETSNLGVSGDLLVLITPGAPLVMDPVTLEIIPLAGDYNVSMPVQLPESLLLTDAVSWEQFLLDLHSGQFLGEGGVWLMDFVAIVIGLLAISGIVMFLLPRENGKR